MSKGNVVIARTSNPEVMTKVFDSENIEFVGFDKFGDRLYKSPDLTNPFFNEICVFEDFHLSSEVLTFEELRYCKKYIPLGEKTDDTEERISIIKECIEDVLKRCVFLEKEKYTIEKTEKLIDTFKDFISTPFSKCHDVEQTVIGYAWDYHNARTESYNEYVIQRIRDMHQLREEVVSNVELGVNSLNKVKKYLNGDYEFDLSEFPSIKSIRLISSLAKGNILQYFVLEKYFDEFNSKAVNNRIETYV